MLDRKYKPKTKKRKLHKRTRKNVKQTGGDMKQKPLQNVGLHKGQVISHRHYFETLKSLNPIHASRRPSISQGITHVSERVAGIQGFPQLPRRAYATPPQNGTKKGTQKGTQNGTQNGIYSTIPNSGYVNVNVNEELKPILGYRYEYENSHSLRVHPPVHSRVPLRPNPMYESSGPVTMNPNSIYANLNNL